MLVYRDGRRTIELDATARALRASCASGARLDALLRAGELECALADAEDEAHAAVALVTDAAALALVGDRALEPTALAGLEHVRRRSARVSEPEGFAYYGVHPLDYAEAITRAVPRGASAWIVGIRTIGCVLSAVACAALRASGHSVERDTVRPTGHPFDRTLALAPASKARAERAARRGSFVAIVDEGPGRSGSSFLAVADALVAAGIARDRIVLLPSHEPVLELLVARDAARRWSALRRVVASPTRARPAGACVEVSAGGWRAHAFREERAWPAVWPHTERRKYLLESGELAKLEGLGASADAARARAEALYEAGIGPRPRQIENGFVAYERIAGRPMSSRDRAPLDELVRRIAVAPASSPEPHALRAIEEMTRTNLTALIGADALRGREAMVELSLGRAVIADGRLAPHEWVRGTSAIVKTDGISHGDDHFFPGPCDVAWDLAGAIAEWDLDRARSDALLDGYARATGDHGCRARLPGWMLAYVSFRAAWLTTARDVCRGTAEAKRLGRAASRMRARLATLLA